MRILHQVVFELVDRLVVILHDPFQLQSRDVFFLAGACDRTPDQLGRLKLRGVRPAISKIV